jgi:hypothetical protein
VTARQFQAIQQAESAEHFARILSESSAIKMKRATYNEGVSERIAPSKNPCLQARRGEEKGRRFRVAGKRIVIMVCPAGIVCNSNPGQSQRVSSLLGYAVYRKILFACSCEVSVKSETLPGKAFPI